MPKSKVPKKRLFREFSLQDKKYIRRNYLKKLKIKYASENLVMNRNNTQNRFIYPLVNKGYLYKHFDKLTPSQTFEDHLFREETKYNYRVRYALTQKGRLLVQRVYREFEG